MLKDIKKVKEIVDWLNEEFPDDRQKQFIAYLDRNEKFPTWHIACLDYFLYASDEYKATMEAIKEYYSFRFVACALNWLGNWVMQKRRETQDGHSVIIVR